MEKTERGVVIKSTGSWYKVKTDAGDVFDCRLKGKFRIKGLKTTNPVTVGDRVMVTARDKESRVITEIDPRRNYLIRRSSKLSKQYHLVAANVDQILLITTVTRPKLVYGLIDRILISAEAYGIPAVIVFNKRDLYNEKAVSKLREALNIYRDAGYDCLVTSARSGEGMRELREVLTDKKTVITGQSGVGKSTLINTLCPGLDLKTAEISHFNEKGKHTTTFSEMHFLDFGGAVIDTPGMRSFGIADFKREHLAHYFPEMRRLMNDCKFNNCVHINEPGCAVKNAVEEGTISARRFVNYLEIYENENAENEYL